MIKADFIVNADSQIISFQITGHADSGPYGSDIVCAAVSAVSIGTINSLQKLAVLNQR
ncbi:ribosomal-processing cysteine protease Prp [Latilactobacillus sakei]